MFCSVRLRLQALSTSTSQLLFHNPCHARLQVICDAINAVCKNRLVRHNEVKMMYVAVCRSHNSQSPLLNLL